MISNLLTRPLRACAAAGLAALSLAPVASQAAVYVADFDPAYGAAYPDLGFRGTATVFVPDACLSLGFVFTSGSGFDQTVSGACAGDDMRIQSATLELYSLSSNLVLGSTTITPVGQATSPLINFVRIENGAVNGLDTDYFGNFSFGQFENSNLPLDLWMYFLEPAVIPAAAGKFAPAALPLSQVFVCDKDPGPNTQTCGSSGNLSNAAQVNGFTLVPEPGSLAVSLAALGALGFASRASARRRRQPPAA